MLTDEEDINAPNVFQSKVGGSRITSRGGISNSKSQNGLEARGLLDLVLSTVLMVIRQLRSESVKLPPRRSDHF